MESFSDDQQPGSSSKVGNIDQQLSVLSDSEIESCGDNFDQPGSSNAIGGEDNDIDYGNSLSVEGLKCSLHGTIYQLKLSILFLQTALKNGYKFKLYSEKKDAEKFDDVVFQYDRDGQYRFLQAKHTLNSEKIKITEGDLVSKDFDEPYCLQKYFISFRRIEQKPQYKGKIKDLVICTNADFNIKEKYIKEDKDYKDDILNVRGGKCYKFIFSDDSPIVEKLKEPYDLNRLVEDLVEVVFDKEKQLNLRNKLFKNYHVPLRKEVFDEQIIKENGKSKKYYCKFKDDFVKNNNLSKGAKLLRKSIETTTIQRGKINSVDLWKTLGEKELAVSSTFGKPIDETSCVFSEEMKQFLPNDFIPDAEIEKFFEKLVFAVEQPNEEELGELIQEEIRNSIDCLKDCGHVELIFDHVQKQMLDWLKSPRSISLTEKDNFFKNGAEKLNAIMHSIPHRLYCSRIKKIGVIFDDTSTQFKELKDFLNFKGNKIFNIISSEKSIVLSQAKFHLIKQQSAWPLEDVLMLNKYSACKEKILYENNRLVILCENESQYEFEDIRRLYNELAVYINNYNKKIVLITQSNSILANYFKNGSLKNDYKEMSDITNVEDLDQKYLEEKLLKKTVNFQGQKTNLTDLLGIKDKKLNINILKVLKQETLSELIFDKNIKVGNELPDFNNPDSPYRDRYHINITRKFNHQIICESSLSKCMKTCKNDIFAFCSTVDDLDLNNMIPRNEIKKAQNFTKKLISDEKFFGGRFFVLHGEEPEKDFEGLIIKSKGKNVHWIMSNYNEKFVLKRSSKLSDIRKFLSKEYSKNTEHLTDLSVIIDNNHSSEKLTDNIDIPMSENLLSKCIAEHQNDLFAFHSITENQLNKLVPPREEDTIRKFSEKLISDKEFFDGRFFIFTAKNSEEDFKDLFINRNGEYVHWFTNIDSDKFTLKYSSKLSNLRQFISTENSIKEIEDLTDSSVIIAGDPGIGKSTVLTTYATILCLPLWFIRVNLKNHEICIKDANFKQLEGIIEFFFKIGHGGLQTALAKSLLEYRLTHDGHVILLLDGYDEINDQNQEKVICLLKTLKDTKGKVWLTTRIHKQYEVENALGIFSYRLNPFDKGQQHEFLKQFWIRKLDLNNLDQEKQNRIDDFTKDLLKQLRGLNIMREGDLVGIVLQARMVADIFSDECEKYLEHRNFNFSKARIKDIFDLYERFIEYQYKIYFTEKIKISKELLGKGSQMILTKSYTDAHGCLAMKMLFSDDQLCKRLLREQAYQMFLQDEICSMGFIKNFTGIDNVDFIHRTYAEYFLAKLLINMVDKGKDHSEYKLVLGFLLRNIFFDRNKLIRVFFECGIKKKSALNNKWDAIQQDCNLLRKIETKTLLPTFNVLTVKGSEKSLNELEEQSDCLWSIFSDHSAARSKFIGGNYSVLLKKFFENFLKETDCEKLKTTLGFIAGMYERPEGILSGQYNMYNAITHYIILAKLKNELDIKFVLYIIKYVIHTNKESLKSFKCALNKYMHFSNGDKKSKLMDDLIYFLIPRNRYKKIRTLENLNYFYCLLDIRVPDITEDINSIGSSLKKYTKKIINFLANAKYDLKNAKYTAAQYTDLKSLQSFFIHVAHHPNIIGCTISYVNKVFKNKPPSWLRNQGIKICMFSKILTPTMPEILNPVLTLEILEYKNIISANGVFRTFIEYILNIMETEDLPQINQLAFFQMIEYFTDKIKTHSDRSTCKSFIKRKQWFPFNSIQLKTIVGLIGSMLNEQHKSTLENTFKSTLKSVKTFLYMVRMGGLNLIKITNQKLLVLDPASGFQCELSIKYMNEIINGIKLNYVSSEFFKNRIKAEKSRKTGTKKRKSVDDLPRINKRRKVIS